MNSEAYERRVQYAREMAEAQEEKRRKDSERFEAMMLTPRPRNPKMVPIKPQSQEFISAIEFRAVKEFIANELKRWPEKNRREFAFHLTNLANRLCRDFNVEVQEVQLEPDAELIENAMKMDKESAAD